MSSVSPVRSLQTLKDGIAAAKAGDKAHARELLREVTAQEPRNELAWLWLGGVAETPHAVVEALQHVLEINPANERAKLGLKSAWLHAGIADAKQGKKEAARKQLLALTNQDPDNELAWLWLASVAASARDQVTYLERVVRVNPVHERALAGLKTARIQAGVAEAQAGNKAAARQLLQAVVEQDPGNEMAWLWLSSIAEKPADAIRALEKVLQINPRNDRAAEGLKYFKSQAATTQAWHCPFCDSGAPQALERCNNCNAVMVLTQADALLVNDKVNPTLVKDAVRRLEEQVKTRADFQTYLHLGVGYANLREYDQAAKFLHAAIRQRPNDGTFRNQVGALIRRREALELAAKEQEKKSQKLQALPKTIMVVDDSPTVRKLVAITMERQGYRVVQAGDGYEAVDMIRRDGAPDMVLLDINMPGLDGYQLCKLIRQHPETKQIPVIMLSGKDGFFDKVRGRIAGSSFYITKPFKPEQLVEVAARYCPIGT